MRIAYNPKDGSHFGLSELVAVDLRDRYKEQKGLKNGYCNRYACQAPIGSNPELGDRVRPQWSMRDHEFGTESARLYYCQPCAFMFNDSDRRAGVDPRCSREGM